VTGLPIAEWNAQGVHESAVRTDTGLGQRFVFVFGKKNQVARLAPFLEQRFERLPHDRLLRRARHAAQRLQVIQVVLDEKLAQWGQPAADSTSSTVAPIRSLGKRWSSVIRGPATLRPEAWQRH
jgi:hypothetical protein